MKGEWIRRASDGGASVVFVHGILSSGERCWQHSNGTYWPKLLKDESDFESLGIYVYTYQTGFASGSYSLSDTVDDLKEHLINLDHVLFSKKIIFVCHSMGGIIVRKFLVERIQDLIERQIDIGLYFVASPSLGSDYANWLAFIAEYAGHAQAQALRFSQANQWLNDLDKTFHNLKESGRLKLHGKELVEDKFIILKKFPFLKQVVEPFSGARYFGESIKVAGSDHFSIAKPKDKNAFQHRLLLAFIEKMPGERLLPKLNKTRPDQKPFLSSGKSINVPQSWQNKLKTKLIEQLKCPELAQVAKRFIEQLVADNPALTHEPEQIAEFLVTGQAAGDNRRKVILHFLSVAQSYAEDQTRLEQLHQLLAFLLQTLVAKCEVDHGGLVKLPVKRQTTVELINATRKTIPVVPRYGEENEELEFKLGEHARLYSTEKNELSKYDKSDFQPESGVWNVDLVCQEIAKELLQQLGEKNVSPENALETLTGRLSRYDAYPGDARLQGIYVHEEVLAKHPFSDSTVVRQFNQMTENRLSIYGYGRKDKSAAKDWLHSEEEKIRGIVAEENQIVKKYNALRLENQSTTEESSMKGKGQSVTASGHSTVIITNGDIKNAQVGSGNIKIVQENSVQLIDLLDKLLQDANQANEVDKQQYAELVRAVDDIKTELQKSQNADRGVLNKAKNTLDRLKDIGAIANSINSIIRLFSTFID